MRSILVAADAVALVFPGCLPGRYAGISGVTSDGSAMPVLIEGGAAGVSLAGGEATLLVAPGHGGKGLVESVAWSR
jgi:hypothetical protein